MQTPYRKQAPHCVRGEIFSLCLLEKEDKHSPGQVNDMNQANLINQPNISKVARLHRLFYFAEI